MTARTRAKVELGFMRLSSARVKSIAGRRTTPICAIQPPKCDSSAHRCSGHGNTRRKNTLLPAASTGRNSWFVAVEPASVNQEFPSPRSTELVSTRQPVWSGGQASSSVLPVRLAVTFVGLSATVEVMLNVPIAGAQFQWKPFGNAGRFVVVNAPLEVLASKIWKESPAHNVPPRFV